MDASRIKVARGAEIGILFRDLVGKAVQVKDAPPVKTPEMFYAIASFEREDGSLGASFAIDLQLAAGLAAALTMVPMGVVESSVRAKKLDEILEENLAEVINVAGRFFNSASSPRVILKGIVKPPVAGEMAKLWASAPTRSAFELAPAGYKPGRIALVAN